MTAIQDARTSATRRKLLDAAFHDFFRHGFQAASLTSIVESAQVTKGALFHHFSSKQALGYAVVDEVVVPLLADRWLTPLASAADPLSVLQHVFQQHIRADIHSGHWVFGCPMNNLAQEMSPLDEGFHRRLEPLYDRWRKTVALALAEGQRLGTVRSDVEVTAAATLVVLSQIGIWSTGKHSRDAALMTSAGDAICDYLETLRPPVVRYGPRVVRRTPLS